MPGVRWKKLTCGDLPEPRWGHTSSQYGSNIIIFGGTGNSKWYNDINIYDTVRNSWSKPEVRGAVPSPRLGHSTTVLPDGRFLVFGGRFADKHYADIHIFDPARFTWVKSPQSASKGISGHTAVLSPDGAKIIIFGGTSAHYKYFTSTYVLDIATLTVTKHETKGDSPSKRGGHCAFVSSNKMFVFGGYDGKKYYNDLYCLNLESLIWNRVEAVGNLPKPRSGHTATLINDGSHLLVFGGCGANSDFFADVHILSLTDLTWDQPKCLGMEPAPRFRHTCTEVGNLLYVFSGTGSGNLLADLMLLELDYQSPPRSPVPHSHAHTHTLSSPHHTLHTPHTPHTPPHTQSFIPLEPPEKGDIDPAELRRLYFTAMMSLKAEKQQREDCEAAIIQLEKELMETRHLLAVEKSVRITSEERLLEEHRNSAKLAQTAHSKIEKVTKKKQKVVQALQDTLAEEQQKTQALAKQVEELTEALAQEKKIVKELRQALSSVETRSQEGVLALTKELEEMRISIAHMHGQELDTLSLEGLIDLESKHTQAFQHIFTARSQRQEEEALARKAQLLHLTQENQRLESGKAELETKLSTVVSDLHRCQEELSHQQAENETLKEKASRLEGVEMEGLSLSQLQELENLHHEGLRRVSQMRQEHMEKELAALREEKKALQEKQMCIICTERPCNCVLLPCRHNSMCINCCELLTRCPICRSEITKRIHTPY